MAKREVVKKQLLQGEKSIGVWGTGYIGFSTMANYAVNGVRSLGTDISKEKVEAINSGALPVPNMEYWLGFNSRPLVQTGLIHATADWKELVSKDVAVHFVAVPTEKEDKPWDEALLDVINKVAKISRCPPGRARGLFGALRFLFRHYVLSYGVEVQAAYAIDGVTSCPKASLP
jgi:UDP-N-acetyl-D-mannosaminuronate dehydrogenase